MKKILLYLFASLVIVFSQTAFAEVKNNGTVPTEQEILVRNQKLIDRLEEIKAMETSKLSKAEKRELRKEVKEIQKTMDIGGGVYISVGALILIIILLIILL